MKPSQLIVRDPESLSEVVIDISDRDSLHVQELRGLYNESIQIDELTLFDTNTLEENK